MAEQESLFSVLKFYLLSINKFFQVKLFVRSMFTTALKVLKFMISNKFMPIVKTGLSLTYSCHGATSVR